MTNGIASALLLLATLLLGHLLHVEILHFELVEIPEHFETVEHIRHAVHAVKHHHLFASRLARH
jgi:hypothetical protein